MIANSLTLTRLLLAAPAAMAFARPDLIAPALLLLIIAVAIATDSLDGLVARKTGSSSASGQLFDHGADCVFVTACLAGAAYAGLVTAWLPTLISIAFLQYVLDSRLLYREKQLRMSLLGRWNGILYFVPLVVLAVARLDTSLAPILNDAGRWLAWLLVVSTLVSIADRAIAPLRSGTQGV